jgi:hypothetical protein
MRVINEISANVRAETLNVSLREAQASEHPVLHDSWAYGMVALNSSLRGSTRRSNLVFSVEAVRIASLALAMTG